MAVVRFLLLVLLLTTVQAGNQKPCNLHRDSQRRLTMTCTKEHNLVRFPAYSSGIEVFILTGTKDDPYRLDWAAAFRNLPPTLTEMTLRYTDLPLIDLPASKNLPKLTKLDLSNNRINHIKSLRGLTGLKELNISHNKLTGLPSNQFKELGSLEVLDLSNNQMSRADASIFNGLSNLRILRLSQNGLYQLLASSQDASHANSYVHRDFFSKLPKLEELNLSQNSLGALETDTFRNQEHLKKIDLSSAGIGAIGDDAFGPLNLEILDLSSNQIQSFSIWAFKDLNCTTLRLTGEMPKNFEQLGRALLEVKSIETLDLSSSRIEDNDLPNETFFKGLEHSLVRLNLSNNLLTKLPKLPEFTRIQELDFSHNRITAISKGSDFNIAEFSKKIHSRQAFLYLHDNPFICNFPCDISILVEFEELNHKCKESDDYCLTCNQPENRRHQKIIDLSNSSDFPADCEEPIRSAVQGHRLMRGNFIYFLMITILTAVLFIFVILLFVFRKKVFRSIYQTGEYNASVATSQFSRLLKKDAENSNGSVADPAAKKLIGDAEMAVCKGNGFSSKQDQETRNLSQAKTADADSKAAADATKSILSTNGVGRFEKLPSGSSLRDASEKSKLASNADGKREIGVHQSEPFFV